MQDAHKDRFLLVDTPAGGKVRMLLPRQHDGGWPYSQEMLSPGLIRLGFEHGAWRPKKKESS
jgi:hypothetical protein